MTADQMTAEQKEKAIEQITKHLTRLFGYAPAPDEIKITYYGPNKDNIIHSSGIKPPAELDFFIGERSYKLAFDRTDHFTLKIDYSSTTKVIEDTNINTPKNAI